MSETKTVKAGERTQHTPGPWEAKCEDCAPKGDDNGLRFWTIRQPGYRGDVAHVHQAESINGITRAERDANARLIAAAPDLLATLSELVDAIWDGRLESEGAEHFTDPARAAIAKAEGR